MTALYLSDVSIRGGRDVGFRREVKWDLDLLAGYRSMFLGGCCTHTRPGGVLVISCAAGLERFRSGRYDALWLHGHNYAANLLALLAAKSVGLPVMMRGETHLGLPCGRVKSLLRRPLMGALYRACDRLLAIGSANAAFYRAMGVPDEKIFLVPYAVDNDRFRRPAALSGGELVKCAGVTM